MKQIYLGRLGEEQTGSFGLLNLRAHASNLWVACERGSFIIATWGIKSAWNYYVECDSINFSVRAKCVGCSLTLGPNQCRANEWRISSAARYMNEETPADFYTRVFPHKKSTLAAVSQHVPECARALYSLALFYYLKKAQQQRHTGELLKSIAAPLSARCNLSNFHCLELKRRFHSLWLDARA